jgi:hypothetical protein
MHIIYMSQIAVLIFCVSKRLSFFISLLITFYSSYFFLMNHLSRFLLLAINICNPSGSSGGRCEAIRIIYYSDRQLPPGHDPGADSGEAPSAGSVAHGQ